MARLTKEKFAQPRAINFEERSLLRNPTEQGSLDQMIHGHCAISEESIELGNTRTCSVGHRLKLKPFAI
jgi:hypothetical protein